MLSSAGVRRATIGYTSTAAGRPNARGAYATATPASPRSPVTRAMFAGAKNSVRRRSRPASVAEAVADTLPHRRKYLLLGHRLSRRMPAVHLELLDEVERELA